MTDPAEIAAFNKNAKYAVALSEAGFTTSQFIEPGGYLKLNNLTIGYTLPNTITDKTFIKNARVYLTGTNFLTLSKYSGLDPEIGISTLTPGFDSASYPRPITVTAGLSVTF